MFNDRLTIIGSVEVCSATDSLVQQSDSLPSPAVFMSVINAQRLQQPAMSVVLVMVSLISHSSVYLFIVSDRQLRHSETVECVVYQHQSCCSAWTDNQLHSIVHFSLVYVMKARRLVVGYGSCIKTLKLSGPKRQEGGEH